MTTDMIFEQEIFIPFTFTIKKRQSHFIYFATAVIIVNLNKSESWFNDWFNIALKDCHIGLSFIEEKQQQNFSQLLMK